ncbi:FitA-like ribbon-helix-helix domain-containing protein [Rhizobium sp. AG207R]|uniref:FitA-like ribbon-helix-helix domain-containing protein n=1 Tax=Rhizobium sp. AG207R TaxID=2802287 RepID=UPI0022AC5DDB|nr:plasmid stabilization protein [Rhizobium sp. AG207R]MCZ3376051.1 plasmid stabilization protein [Rhizobium sp. AG207R]
MASMTIRNIDDHLKTRLRIRAAAHGRSMEDEARDILRAALLTEEKRQPNLAETIRRRMAARASDIQTESLGIPVDFIS